MAEPGVPPSGPQHALAPADPGPRTPGPVSAGPRPPATGHASPEEPPPFGRSWPALYVLVAGTLVALIVLFAVFTRAFG